MTIFDRHKCERCGFEPTKPAWIKRVEDVLEWCIILVALLTVCAWCTQSVPTRSSESGPPQAPTSYQAPRNAAPTMNP